MLSMEGMVRRLAEEVEEEPEIRDISEEVEVEATEGWSKGGAEWEWE